jgi:outer membrane receptor protein involved in Fe transport
MKQTVLKLTSSLLLGIGGGLWAICVSAQDTEPQAERRSFLVAPSSILSKTTPIIDVARDAEAQDFEGAMVEEALNFNLGVKITPIEGLNLQADAWLQEIADAPAVTVNTAAQSALPKLFIEDSAINEFNIQNPLIGTQLQSNGFDLGASYVWDTSRFGQFTLSTKATYVQSFENNGSLLELLDTEAATLDDRVISPEFQSSLMLTWQLGNHSAKAITNYFDSFKDVSELDLEEINALIDDITTVDLQYGYSVETSSNNRAIISFGIRNIFDEKTAQILNSSTRILDQNGRIAYGSIKYQF